MAVTGLKPIFMKNSKLVLGDYSTGTPFECQLRSINLTPDTNIVKAKTLCPDGQFSEVENPEWELELGYLGMNVTDGQAEALADFLLENQGTKVPFHFEPVKGQGKGYSGQVTLVPGGIGGEQGSFSEQSVNLPLDGQPVPYESATGPAPAGAAEANAFEGTAVDEGGF